MEPVILRDDILRAAVSIAATDTDPDSFIYDVLNLLDGRKYTHHKFAGPGTKYYTMDCGSPVAADALGIVGHNLGSAAATVSLEYSSDNFAADINEALPGFVPSDDRAILKTFNSVLARYWRLKVVTAASAAKLGELLIGARITLPYPPDTPYNHYDEGGESDTKLSETGNPLQTYIAYEDVKFSVRVSTLERSWVTGTFKPFWDAHGIKKKHFLFAMDLDAFPEDVYWVRFPKGYRFRMPLRIYPTVESLELEMEGLKE